MISKRGLRTERQVAPGSCENPQRVVTSRKGAILLYWIIIVLLVLFAAFMVMRSRTRRR
jgi:hypothetical protein